MPVLDGSFEAFVTNLGKYNEGELVGEWVHFPTTEEEMKAFYDHWQSVVCWMQYDAGVAPVSPETFGIERP